MPPRRCCCGCYTFYDAFAYADIPEMIASGFGNNWEHCGLDSDWQIDGGLKNTLDDPVMVLLKMVGNPVGILEAEVNMSSATDGTKYRILVFQGSDGLPCSGTSDTYVELEKDDSTNATMRVVIGGVPATSISGPIPADDMTLKACISNGGIEATSELGTIRECEQPTDWYFALQSIGMTQWKWIRYTDHFDHNRRCPKCGVACCFSDFDQTIAGFYVQLHGIANDACTPCANINFEVVAPEGTDLCGCNLSFTGGVVSGPHPCDAATSEVSAQVGCSESGIAVTIQIQPDDSFGSTLQVWEKVFPAGTSPHDISGIIPFDTGGGGSCDYTSSHVTITPIVVEGCCDQPPPAPTALAATSDARRQRKMDPEDKARWIKWVEMFRSKEDRGVGDTVERLLAKVGGRSIKKILHSLGQDCGCSNRQKWLNRKYPYSS